MVVEAQPVLAPHRKEVGIFQLATGDFLGGIAKHGFADSARVAENDAGAGFESHRHVKRFGLKPGKAQAGLLDHARQFLGREHVVDLRQAVAAELGSLGLEFFGRAGHDGDDDEVFAFDAEFFRQQFLAQRARAFAGAICTRRGWAGAPGKYCSANFTQPGTAAGEQRQFLAFGLALQKLVRLLDDREIGAEGGVIDFIEPEPLERGDHLAAGRFAGGHSEQLADGDAHGGSNLRDDGFGRIVAGPSRPRRFPISA